MDNIHSGRIAVVMTRMAAVILAVTTHAAAAVTLAPASFVETVSVFSTHGAGRDALLAESVTVNPIFGRGTGIASASASNVYPLSAQLSVDLHGADSPASFGGSASVYIDYQFAVEALDPGLPDQVPVTFAAEAHGSVHSADGSGTILVRLDYPHGRWEISNCTAFGCSDGEYAFDETDTFTVTVDKAYLVSTDMLIHGQGGGLGFVFSGQIDFDPTLIVDPAFAHHDRYRIVLSPGIAAVPVPDSLALFTPALLALLVRRRS